VQTEPRADLPKSYEPAAVEARVYRAWLDAGVFHEEPDPARPPFIVSMPPPNITGRAHLGHASTYTAMDILTRYHRMLGENADWLPGQDHAAIATEAVLVREIAKEGLTREGLGREQFLERAWKWRELYGDAIYESFRTLGFGPDWERDRFTMDEGLSAAVTRVFVELHREGLIYRGTRLVNWDPVSQSTLSDAEVEDEERDGFLWGIRYASADGSFAIEVATTRPETMLGDTADRRASRRRTLRASRRKDASSFRLRAARFRSLPMRCGGTRVRHGCGEDHAGSRSHGQCDRRTACAADADRDRVRWQDDGRHSGSRTSASTASMRAQGDRSRPRMRSGVLTSTTPRRHVVPVSSRSGAVVEPLLSLAVVLQDG
jgi:hypothetical protein